MRVRTLTTVAHFLVLTGRSSLVVECTQAPLSIPSILQCACSGPKRRQRVEQQSTNERLLHETHLFVLEPIVSDDSYYVVFPISRRFGSFGVLCGGIHSSSVGLHPTLRTVAYRTYIAHSHAVSHPSLATLEVPHGAVIHLKAMTHYSGWSLPTR